VLTAGANRPAGKHVSVYHSHSVSPQRAPTDLKFADHLHPAQARESLSKRPTFTKPLQNKRLVRALRVFTQGEAPFVHGVVWLRL
jgi:hypothetical protein